jgi:hypothetical protein
LQGECPLKINKNDLLPHWCVVAAVLVSLAAYLFACQHFGRTLQDFMPEERRITIRTIFYAIAIITFPLTNMIRHIQLRLNQTMPGDKSATSRYLLTVIVSMAFVESIGVLGFVMYWLGDDFNTLYIFLGLSLLGAYLYRPKESEYADIVEALGAGKD